MTIHFGLARDLSHTPSTSRNDFQINIARHRPAQRELCCWRCDRRGEGGERERAKKAGTWRLTWIFDMPISPAWNRPIESQHRTFVQAESIAWSCRCRSSRVSLLAELFVASLYRSTHGDFTQYLFFHMNIFLFSTQHTQRDLHHEEVIFRERFQCTDGPKARFCDRFALHLHFSLIFFH